jgi:hypothetical protein
VVTASAVHLSAKLFLRRLRVTAEIPTASAKLDTRCSGGVSEY